jgi:imidazolonepropionase-like amidohydrolase
MADTLFTNVRIIDGTGTLPYTGSVLVQGNRIRQVGRSTAAISPTGATVIDAAGATLMPGMCEAHTHFSWNDAATLAAIQAMPLEEHVLWCAKVAKRYLQAGLDILRRRGVRQAAARRRGPQRHQRRADSRAALPGGQPGDHGAGRAG